MAIEKFRFVSPGVQINEIDDSVIAPVPPAIGPVVIGRTAKGPSMQPVRVSSVGELEKVFGAPSNGLNSVTADVWRTGVPTAPTFATYAAKAFLRNSSPVTIIRLAGVDEGGITAAAPGYTVSSAYHVFATSGSTATLAAVIYASSSVAFQVSNSVGGFSSANSASYSGAGDLYLSASSGRTKIPVSFNNSSTSFIRNVLVTNPTLYSHPIATTRTNYFLGESFENSIGFTPTNIYITSSAAWVDFSDPAISAETGYVTSDHSNGSDPTDLFKFVGLNSGASLSREIKISIENVRASKNTAVTKYGTFDVVVRKLFEAGSISTVLEKFIGVNLDPASPSYILRAIGDSYRQWDGANSRYVEYGLYPNRSAYIRVELAAGDLPATALPHGFRLRAAPSVTAASLTAAHPDVEIFTDTIKTTAAKTKRFGIVTDSKENADIIDIIRYKPVASLSMSGSLFSTRYIDAAGTNVAYSGSAFYNSSDVLTAGTILGFDMPIYGGFDGLDAREQEPMVNKALLNGKDETSSNAYRAISQVLDLVADPENLDMNVLCVPNLKNANLTSKMIQVCRTRGDAMAIIDLEGDYEFPWETSAGTESRPTSVASVVASLEGRAIDDSYGAAYFPAVFVQSETTFMPASIAALGAFGGTEGRSALWFAPAGFNRGGLTEGNAGIGVSRTALTLNSSDKDLLYTANINPIATFPNEGVVIFGQKTLQQTPSALDRVNVRRLLNYIKKEISRASTRVLFEPNVKDTWNNFKGTIEPFLLNIKSSFGLDDVKVILDETTTTADLVDRNIMYCKILLKPTRAIEFIAIDFVVTNSGASFTE